MIDRQYGAIQLEDAEVRTSPGAVDSVLAAVQADPGVSAAEPFGRYDVTLSSAWSDYQTLLTVLRSDTRMHRFTVDSAERMLPARGVLLAQGAQETLGVDVEDPVTITVTQTGQRLNERVAGFVNEPMNPVAYMSTERLTQRAGTLAATGVLLRLKPGASEEAVSRRINAVPGVVAYLSTNTVETAMREAFTLYDALVGLMLAFAVLMAAALLYNAMSANVAERSVELGTLRAAGMGASMLGRLIATENLALVVLGLRPRPEPLAAAGEVVPGHSALRRVFVLDIVAVVVVIIVWFAVLFTGRYPRALSSTSLRASFGGTTGSPGTHSCSSPTSTCRSVWRADRVSLTSWSMTVGSARAPEPVNQGVKPSTFTRPLGGSPGSRAW